MQFTIVPPQQWLLDKLVLYDTLNVHFRIFLIEENRRGENLTTFFGRGSTLYYNFFQMQLTSYKMTLQFSFLVFFYYFLCFS